MQISITIKTGREERHCTGLPKRGIRSSSNFYWKQVQMLIPKTDKALLR